ncbi:MAG TPA: ABC transporter permease subunit [Thermodesulfobacteriota bacterium]
MRLSRLPMMSSLLLWGLLWEAVGRAGLVPIVPPLTEVVVTFGRLLGTETFVAAVWNALASFALGLVLAIVIGIPLGVLMGRVAAADRLLGLWVNVFASAPLTALVPVLMLLFGLGTTTVVVTVVLFALWIIVLDTRAGIRDVSPSLVEMAQAFGASRAAVYRKVLFFAALPEILAGVRLGFIRAVKGVVIGQLLVSIIGLGELFELYSRNFLMREFWALTLGLFVFALVGSAAIGLLERRVEYYAASRG